MISSSLLLVDKCVVRVLGAKMKDLQNFHVSYLHTYTPINLAQSSIAGRFSVMYKNERDSPVSRIREVWGLTIFVPEPTRPAMEELCGMTVLVPRAHVAYEQTKILKFRTSLIIHLRYDKNRLNLFKSTTDWQSKILFFLP